jgi:hypothetical protein
MGTRGSFPGSKTARMNLNTHFHLVPRWRMSGAIMPHMYSWCAPMQLYLYLYLYFYLASLHRQVHRSETDVQARNQSTAGSLHTQEYIAQYANINHALLVILTPVFVVVQSFLLSFYYKYMPHVLEYADYSIMFAAEYMQTSWRFIFRTSVFCKVCQNYSVYLSVF